MAVYLVTGGAGFIGSNIVAELLGRGEQVRVLDNFMTGRRGNLAPFLNDQGFELIEGDIRDAATVAAAVSGCEFVLHQAALPSVPRSIKDPVLSHEVNVLGTLNLLEASRKSGVRRLVYASSSSIYGNSTELPKHEEMVASPLSPYALTKYTAERYCRIYTDIYGLETVSLRYFNVFGPNQDPGSEYSAVIPRFADIIARGGTPVIYGDGEQSRDFTYVSNNVEANLLACSAEGVAGQVFNIACGERFTLSELVSRMATIMGVNVHPEFAPERLGDVKHSIASISKARQLLGYNPGVGFEEGLGRYLATLLHS